MVNTIIIMDDAHKLLLLLFPECFVKYLQLDEIFAYFSSARKQNQLC